MNVKWSYYARALDEVSLTSGEKYWPQIYGNTDLAIIASTFSPICKIIFLWVFFSKIT